MESHDSLPYIDADISQAERDAANRIIYQEIASDYHLKIEHPSLQSSRHQTQFSELISQEIARHAETGQKARTAGGIDLSRYEAPEEPSTEADVAEWKNALRNAYVSSTYLSGRRANLTLLDEFGKNAWLLGNYKLESILRKLETDLADTKAQTEVVNKNRKIAQEGVQGELVALEQSWKTVVGKLVEVQISTEQLRNELMQSRRGAAG